MYHNALSSGSASTTLYTTLMVVGAAVSWDQEATIRTYVHCFTCEAVERKCANICSEFGMCVFLTLAIDGRYICIDLATIQQFISTLK